MKKLISTLAAFTLFITGIFAKTVSFQTESYSGTITYNENAQLGDAVFARLKMKINKSAKKKNSQDVQAVLQLYKDNKNIDNSTFYFLNSKTKRQSMPDMLAGIPISTWFDAQDEFSLKIVFSTGIGPDQEVILPFDILDKEFEKEVLDLNEKNSGIRQNLGPERMAQIEKLNNILGTVMYTNIYSLKPFIKPVKTERLTAHFGDRRIYNYTNGKSSTSLHYGNDYGVPEGTEVSACTDGKVVLAEFRISTGWSVVIEHLPGLYSLYYHLSSLDVKEGDFVKSSQKIGSSGSTGLATGPHLHWEIRLNMAAVAPEFFMNDYTFNDMEIK